MAESTKMTLDEFLVNETLKRAFARSLEIIGEAVKQLSTEIILENHNIDWRRIAGMRDKLIHGYFSVDYSLVWDIVINKIPEFRMNIEYLL
ncbi:MAG: DUF86 domain-containing protein [Rectinemataceae bacterium]